MMVQSIRKGACAMARIIEKAETLFDRFERTLGVWADKVF
jgi:hypothetical protein